MLTSVARKYARALVEVAMESGSPMRALEQLRQFLQLFESHRELRETLLNPAIPFSPKRSIVEEICRGLDLDRAVLNFLLVVLENGRVGSLSKLVQAVGDVVDRQQGIVQANLCSASRLGERDRERLEKAVIRLTGSQARLSFRVDPSLLGGWKLQIGSEIYDGSIRTQLEEIQKELVRE